MLSRLSIRDIVLIERLDIDFSRRPFRADRRDRRRQIHPARRAVAGARRARRRLAGAPWRGAGPGHGRVRRAAQPSGARAACRKRHRRRWRHHPAPRADGGRPHPRLRQRPAVQRHADARHRPRAGRDPRPARRARAGRRRRAPRPARRLRRPCRRGAALRRGLAALARLRAGAVAPPRQGRGGGARGRLSARLGRGTVASSTRSPARRPNSPNRARR